jgi:outer membrane biosynthesis protein TonB
VDTIYNIGGTIMGRKSRMRRRARAAAAREASRAPAVVVEQLKPVVQNAAVVPKKVKEKKVTEPKKAVHKIKTVKKNNETNKVNH